MTLSRALLLSAAALLLMPAPAFAYLDAGTGSLILQAIIGGALAAAFTIKMYWRRIVSSVRSLLGKSDSSD